MQPNTTQAKTKTTKSFPNHYPTFSYITILHLLHKSVLCPPTIYSISYPILIHTLKYTHFLSKYTHTTHKIHLNTHKAPHHISYTSYISYTLTPITSTTTILHLIANSYPCHPRHTPTTLLHTPSTCLTLPHHAMSSQAHFYTCQHTPYTLPSISTHGINFFQS